MTALKRQLLPAVIAMVVLTLALGIIYPLLITGIGQLAFPGNSNGQQIHVDGRLIGSKLIGQQFTDVVLGTNGKPKLDSDGGAGGVQVMPDPRYFQSRPSGTVPGYNAAASTFANLGPNDLATKQAIQANEKAYLSLNAKYDPGLTIAKIPVDAVDTSASGLDPDISQANAWIQAHRIAAVRHLSLATVMSEISKYTGGRGVGFSGEPTVNVLELNLALDRISKGAK
jgi:potassium-transporting ATPase KdpC subunit